jgi:UPF0755 protein
VDRGASLSAVSRTLEAQGAISDARIFRIGADYSDKADQLKFGSLSGAAGGVDGQIVGLLTAGGQSTCGRRSISASVTSAELVLRELDPATHRYVEVVKFDPATEAAPPNMWTAAEAAICAGGSRWPKG